MGPTKGGAATGVPSCSWRAFSSRWARNMKSRGDSRCWRAETGLYDVGSSESVAGGEGWEMKPLGWRTSGESLDDFKKLGIGRSAGAGEAWKVAPANGVLEIAFGGDAPEGDWLWLLLRW